MSSYREVQSLPFTQNPYMTSPAAVGGRMSSWDELNERFNSWNRAQREEEAKALHGKKRSSLYIGAIVSICAIAALFIYNNMYKRLERHQEEQRRLGNKIKDVVEDSISKSDRYLQSGDKTAAIASLQSGLESLIAYERLWTKEQMKDLAPDIDIQRMKDSLDTKIMLLSSKK